MDIHTVSVKAVESVERRDRHALHLASTAVSHSSTMRNRIASLTLLVGLCPSDLATHYYDREIVLAKDRARPWQAVLYATNRNIDLLWHYLEVHRRNSLAAGPHQVLREVGENQARTWSIFPTSPASQSPWNFPDCGSR